MNLRQKQAIASRQWQMAIKEWKRAKGFARLSVPCKRQTKANSKGVGFIGKHSYVFFQKTKPYV